MPVETVATPGGHLSYRRWGNGNQLAVVLLHSLGEDNSTWDTVAAMLGTSHELIAFDLPGHGRSGRRAAYSFESLRDEVGAAIASLGIGRVSIVGHSLGGMLGYLLAAQQPGWLARLVLEDTPAPLALAPPRPVPDRPEGPLGFDWDVLVALCGQRNNPDATWWDSLANIAVPVLLLAGGPDSHIDQTELARMAHQIPRCRMATIGGGHGVHANRPGPFVAAVREFLSGT